MAVATAGAASLQCSISPTATDVARGLAVRTDTSCSTGGAGCVSTNCRYCRRTPDSANVNLVLCASISSSDDTLAVAMASQPAAASFKDGSFESTDTCAITVSPGDLAVGVSATTDLSCAGGGLGCFSSRCRYCRMFETPQSASFIICTALTAPSPSPAFELTCSLTVSNGDAAAGIDLLTDVSCVLGGVGCASDVCRFCQVWPTPASADLTRCSYVDDYDGSDISFTPLPAMVPDNGFTIGSPTRPALGVIALTSGPVTRSPAIASADVCAQTVSNGDAAVGISAKRDPSCEFGGLGCFSASCRFCKQYDTPQSSWMLPCTSF